MDPKNETCERNKANISKQSGQNDDETEAEDVIPGFRTFDEFRQAGFKALMEATRISSTLPSGQNWDYYTTFPSFKKIMDSEGARVLKLISNVFHHQGIKGNIMRRDLEEKFDLVVDANDLILERVGFNLDEMSGIRSNPEPVILEAVSTNNRVVSGSWNLNQQQNSSPSGSSNPQPMRLLTAKNIQRPQIKFKDKIDNSSSPFEPRIKDKPNSLKPLSIRLHLSEDGEESFTHPYEYELERFTPSASHLKYVEPQLYKSVEETPLVIIEEENQLPDLVQDLSKYSIIAVDLEHHSYRSFQGFTCLMQISTRDTDYIIDTLELRDKLHCLNEVFTKRSIIKIFHGADHDVEWLQRDLCLYVVNMFDTHQAAKSLNFSQLSLAFLLKHYCNVIVDKRFQLADWRIRPLPENLLLYAREDTHYLLYIYDMMNNALLDAANGNNNLLQSVFQRSAEICKTRYEKPILREDSHMVLYRRNKKLFDNRQLYALRSLYYWRDKIARQEDESIGYVLPNHMLLQISETLPREMQGILACCNPIPPLVRQNLLTIHNMILEAREQPLVKPILAEESRIPLSTQTWIKVNLEGSLHCPHDLTHIRDFRDDLPTLLGSKKASNELEIRSLKINMRKPTISLFETEISASDSDPLNVTFVCPYEQYKRVKPFVQAQEEESIYSTEDNAIESTLKEHDDTAERIQRIKEHFMNVSSDLQIEDETHYANIETPITISSSKYNDTISQPEEIKPLRNKVPKKRKRKHKNSYIPQAENDLECDEHASKIQKLDEACKIDSSALQTTVQTTNVQKKQLKIGKEEGFQPFDYSTVNFNRFQGGSRVNQPKSKSDGKFKSKGKKKGKKGNKSMTFERNRW